MSYNNIATSFNTTRGKEAMGLVRKQTYITPEQDRALKRLAQQQGTTEAEILRRAIDQLLAATGIIVNEDPFDDIIGMLDGPPCKADHDDIYC
jgi:hypothetical protein